MKVLIIILGIVLGASAFGVCVAFRNPVLAYEGLVYPRTETVTGAVFTESSIGKSPSYRLALYSSYEVDTKTMYLGNIDFRYCHFEALTPRHGHDGPAFYFSPGAEIDHSLFVGNGSDIGILFLPDGAAAVFVGEDWTPSDQ